MAKKNLTTNTKSAAIERIVAVKKRLPGSGVTSLFIHKFPEYKTPSERARVQSVLSFRTVDESIIEKLEKLATSIEN